MKSAKRFLSIGLNIVLIYLVVIGVWRFISSSRQHAQLVGTKVPKFSALSLDGQATLIPHQSDEPTVLVFWSTWCTPCTVELARIRNAVAQNEIEGGRIYAVAIGEPLDTVRAAAKERQYNFPVVADPEGQIANAFKVRATPTVIYLNSGGEISGVDTGISPFLFSKLTAHLR